jgi:polar amino acid transport system substrate-binding protein
MGSRLPKMVLGLSGTGGSMGAVRLLALFAWFCLPLARADDVLVVAFDGACVPTMYRDAQGKPAGIYPAIVAAAFAKMGEPLRTDVQPFRRMIAGLGDGTLAGGSVVLTPERAAVAAFSAPYFIETVGAYTRAGAPVLHTIGDLRGKRVGVIRGWSYGPEFDEARKAGAFTAEEVDTDLANFRKLALGRLDAVMATTPAGELLRRQGEFARFGTAPQPLLSAPIRLAINRNDARRRVLERFDVVIEQMRRSGEIDAIANDEIGRAARLAANANEKHLHPAPRRAPGRDKLSALQGAGTRARSRLPS